MTKLKNLEFECLFARLTCLVMGFVTAMAFVFCSAAYAQLTNEESVKEGSRHSDDKGIPSSPMGLILGLRAGAAFPTEKVLKNTGNGTSVGPLVNAEALYALREWVRVGMMLEWHQHRSLINLFGARSCRGTLASFRTANGRVPPEPQHERIL